MESKSFTAIDDEKLIECMNRNYPVLYTLEDKNYRDNSIKENAWKEISDSIGKSGIYFICATPNVFCKGTAVQLIDGTIKANKHHSHDPYGEAFNELEDRRSFRSTLIERSRTETESLRSIYDGESIRDPRAAILYSWPSAESSMRHARRQTLPPLPSTLRELGEYLDLNAERYRCKNSSFYQEWIIDNAGKYSIMFSCQELISAVVHQGATELHADATFKVVPSTPHCQQLFIIHLILQNHSIPVCFVFMEAKTEASYRKVMERFQIKFPEVKPLVIMTDFETALRNAFMYIYPEAQIFSCWFHYVQCLQKNIKRMGYSGYIGQNREAKMCLRMCAALALLPANKIEQGFQEIKNYAHNNEILIPRFFTYFSSFWLIRKGPECFSVHGQPRRTNNNVESFHSTLKQTFQVMHPNLWTMLEHLKNISKKMHIVVDQLAAGLPTTRRVKFKYILNSKRIKNSTALLSTGAITIKEFLIQCSYCTDQYLTTELSWHEEIEESEEEIVPMILNMPIAIAVDAEAIALNHDEVVDLDGMYNAITAK
ncbi:unnamed protein product [Macrosiphum euphorbiae]|uniref:MULE transposase domain-containing protein n=1 Tax=Macrosiphum euphorbiae TaxID=13131 RepID=A0AAV0WTB9_9HEMI|nr:unnamed protein product [Macrosiphum euphorbiae]